MVQPSLLFLPSFVSLAVASILPDPNWHDRLVPRASCSGNTAATRTTWCDLDINTDYYNTVPDTGKTVEYWFEITNTTLAPDGVSRLVQTINGTIPGPTIEANWGDTVKIHVTNSVANNGTSIHFHGIRQNYTNQNDGVSSITQCPTAPGDTITYTWRATQYGSSWYHSHYSFQAWDGVYGPIVIHGPSSANYDIDLGPISLSDWTHQTADTMYMTAELQGIVSLDNGLINGKNTYDNSSGSRYSLTFTPGESHLLRLVNVAIDSHFTFSIDNHTLQVIASDFVPIEPYYTNTLSIGIGQRYDVVVVANQSAVANTFWMRADPDAACSSVTNADIRAIVSYSGATTTPSTTAWSYDENGCTGEPLASVVPVVSKTAGAQSALSSSAVTVGSVNSLFKWYLNDITFNSSWANPTALQVYNNATEYDDEMLVMEAPTLGDWYYILIETTFAVPHPIHLHGHDFHVVSMGDGTYDGSDLNLANPPRRDVQMLPSSGHLVIAFQADNPGVWLLHCHIGWHTEMGLSLQVIEDRDRIMSTYDTGVLQKTCSNWDTYVASAGKTQDNDDGI